LACERLERRDRDERVSAEVGREPRESRQELACGFHHATRR
jgi:hypothetical protein